MRSTNRRRARASSSALPLFASWPVGRGTASARARRAHRRRARLVRRSGDAGRRGERSDRQAAGRGRRRRLSGPDRRDVAAAVAASPRDDRRQRSTGAGAPPSAAAARSTERPAPSWPRRLRSPSRSRCDRWRRRARTRPTPQPRRPLSAEPPPAALRRSPPSSTLPAPRRPPGVPSVDAGAGHRHRRAPQHQPGVELEGELQRGSLRLVLLGHLVRLAGRGWTRTTPAARSSSRSAGALACFAPRRGRWTALACGGVELGRLAGTGLGVARPETGAVFWRAVRAEVGATVALGGNTALLLRGGVGGPAGAPRVRARRQPSWSTGRAAWRSG